MSDKFWRDAVNQLLKTEGGKVTDHAGPTNMGITLSFLKANASKDLDGDGFLDGDYDGDGDVDNADLNVITTDQAISLYKRTFWDKFNYGDLHNHEYVCTKIFDLSVNCGPVQAHKFLQRASRACGYPLVDDGIIGPKTRAIITSIPGPRLVSAMRSEAAGFYRLISSQKPQYRKFLKGWLRRAYSL